MIVHTFIIDQPDYYIQGGGGGGGGGGGWKYVFKVNGEFFSSAVASHYPGRVPSREGSTQNFA